MGPTCVGHNLSMSLTKSMWEKDVKRDLISQTLKDFVKIMQPSDVLKKLRGQRRHVPRARVDPFSMVQVGAYFSHIF